MANGNLQSGAQRFFSTLFTGLGDVARSAPEFVRRHRQDEQRSRLQDLSSVLNVANFQQRAAEFAERKRQFNQSLLQSQLAQESENEIELANRESAARRLSVMREESGSPLTTDVGELSRRSSKSLVEEIGFLENRPLRDAQIEDIQSKGKGRDFLNRKREAETTKLRLENEFNAATSDTERLLKRVKLDRASLELEILQETDEVKRKQLEANLKSTTLSNKLKEISLPLHKALIKSKIDLNEANIGRALAMTENLRARTAKAVSGSLSGNSDVTARFIVDNLIEETNTKIAEFDADPFKFKTVHGEERAALVAHLEYLVSGRGFVDIENELKRLRGGAAGTQPGGVAPLSLEDIRREKEERKKRAAGGN